MPEITENKWGYPGRLMFLDPLRCPAHHILLLGEEAHQDFPILLNTAPVL